MTVSQKYSDLLEKLLQTAVYRKVQIGKIEVDTFNQEDNPNERARIKDQRIVNEIAEMKVLLVKWSEEL
jgi:hypothetical protein